jgi:phage protein D
MNGFIRAPRVVVATDGGSFYPIDCSVDVSQHQSADKFHATLPLDVPGASFWCDTAPINVTVTATNNFNEGGWTQMITGQVDNVEADFLHRIVKISGRDQTANMTDQKTNEKWLNKKPEDVIQDLAGRAGLGVQITGSSKDKAGLKFKDDYNRISEYDNYWNVITRLAKHMGCVAFVKGSTLYVQPYDQSTGGVFVVQYAPPTDETPAYGTTIDLKCTRNLHLSKDVKVKHNSWQHKEGKGVQSMFESSGSGAGTLEYMFKAANLTKSQQDQLAETKLNEILSHERTPHIHTYGDVNITPFMTLQLVGTGTGFDQSYLISTIAHHWSTHDGYKMDINVRNKDSKRGGAKQTK